MASSNPFWNTLWGLLGQVSPTLIWGRILAALLVGGIGMTLAYAARAGRFASIGIRGKIVSDACFYALMSITVLSVLAQFNVYFFLVRELLIIAAAGAVLAAAIGARDTLNSLFCGLIVRQRFSIGDQVRVVDVEGTVREIGPLVTIVETEEDGLAHRRGVPNELMLQEGIR